MNTRPDYKDLNEEILFNRYTGGDTKAFDALLERTKGLVYSLILRYVRNDSEADEIFQEVFFKVCKYKDQFRHSTSFKSWLVTITKNTCIDATRKGKRTIKTTALDEVDTNGERQLSELVADDAAGPADHLDWRLEQNEMEDLLDKLPEEQREVFYLKIVMDMTFEEIGVATAVSTNTAKSRYRYAVATLVSLVKRRRLLTRSA